MRKLVRRHRTSSRQNLRNSPRLCDVHLDPKYELPSVTLAPARVSLGRRSTSRTSTMTNTKRPSSALPNPISDSGSPFLRLPAEVRVCIYRYLLPSSTSKFKLYTDIDSTYTDRKWSSTSLRRGTNVSAHSLAILRASKGIYYEALSVLYSENTFHFVGTNFLPVIDFIRRLSPDAKELVRQLKITMVPEARQLRADQLELFCRVVHEFLPGLNVLDSDSWVWI